MAITPNEFQGAAFKGETDAKEMVITINSVLSHIEPDHPAYGLLETFGLIMGDHMIANRTQLNFFKTQVDFAQMDGNAAMPAQYEKLTEGTRDVNTRTSNYLEAQMKDKLGLNTK